MRNLGLHIPNLLLQPNTTTIIFFIEAKTNATSASADMMGLGVHLLFIFFILCCVRVVFCCSVLSTPSMWGGGECEVHSSTVALYAADGVLHCILFHEIAFGFLCQPADAKRWADMER